MLSFLNVSYVKFLHVFLGINLLGLLLSSYVYLIKTLKKTDKRRQAVFLKASAIADVLIAFILLHQFVTGALLIHLEQLPPKTPWLIAAFVILTLVSVAWLISIALRYRAFRNPHQTNLLILSLVYGFMIFGLIAIVHDAIYKRRFFDKAITNTIERPLRQPPFIGTIKVFE